LSTTGTDGTVMLSGVPPDRLVVFKLSKDGYIPAYSAYLNLSGTLDATGYPFVLYAPAEVADWNIIPGKSVFLVKVLDAAGNPVSGATVSALGSFHPQTPYPVDYSGNGTTFG